MKFGRTGGTRTLCQEISWKRFDVAGQAAQGLTGDPERLRETPRSSQDSGHCGQATPNYQADYLYTQVFDSCADLLNVDGAVRKAFFIKGLKQHKPTLGYAWCAKVSELMMSSTARGADSERGEAVDKKAEAIANKSAGQAPGNVSAAASSGTSSGIVQGA